jgi:hypothetical protein
MATEDWALVVGIKAYPDLGDLGGPENDAVDFYDWVCSPLWGAVPKNQAKLILSRDFPQPFPSVSAAAPTTAAVEQFFDSLDDIANKNNDEGKGQHVGRRLYIYLAGHGFAPSIDDAALLMANATRVRVGYHIPGKPWADWFYRAGYFDEMFLFMDCCRENYPRAPLNLPAYIDVNAPDAVDRGKRFYAFGTKWSRLSRERPMADGKVHGIFTSALMAGLRGGACDPKTGDITALTLQSFLYNNMKRFLDPADLQNVDIPKEPDIFAPNNPAENFLIIHLAVPTFRVRINVPANFNGKTMNIRDDKFKIVDSKIAAPPFCEFDLARGGYLAEIVGGPESQPFEVSGVGTDIAGNGVPNVNF